MTAPLEGDRALVLAASKYRSGADSCNSFYMGSLATCALIKVLGGEFGRDSVETALRVATDAQVADAVKYCAPYIKRMQANPTKPCPHCGQIMPAERS